MGMKEAVNMQNFEEFYHKHCFFCSS